MTEASPPIASPIPAEGQRAWLWPAIIIGMLSVHTLGCLIVMYIANADPSQVVVSDYHAKAVAWDQHQAQVRASDALGWTVAIDPAAQSDMLGQRNVRISLRDAQDQPLTDAEVKLRVYAHARANDVFEAAFGEGAPGEYVATVQMRRQGMWSFTVEVRRGDDMFVREVNQQVGPTPFGMP